MITKMTVQITPEASKGVGIHDFCGNVAAALGLSVPKLRYDCTKLVVARNIRRNIFETPDASSSEPGCTGTAWCRGGPKTDDALPDDTVEVHSGFFRRGATPLALSLKTNWHELLLPSLEQLYDKLTAEYEAFIAELRNAAPDTILERAYEKVFKMEILMCFDSECTFDECEIAAIMALKTPLNDMYRDWMASDVTITDYLREAISRFARRVGITGTEQKGEAHG